MISLKSSRDNQVKAGKKRDCFSDIGLTRGHLDLSDDILYHMHLKINNSFAKGKYVMAKTSLVPNPVLRLHSLIFFVVISLLCSGILGQSLPPIPVSNYELIDDFSSGDTSKLWKPMTGSQPVEVINHSGRHILSLPCKFKGNNIKRAGWDREYKLDLSMCKGVQFLFYCPRLGPVASYNIHFHSDRGWYTASFAPTTNKGWSHITILKKNARIEEQPAGWSKIDKIRISAWRGMNEDTELYLAALGLYGSSSPVILVRADTNAQRSFKAGATVRRFVGIMDDFLDRAGIDHFILSDKDIKAAKLKGTSLLILPYNSNMPETAANEIAAYLKSGGKLLACYTLPAQLQGPAGIHIDELIKQKYDGFFASIHPSENPLEGMPAITEQASWIINGAKPIPGRSRIAAWWYDNKGASTGYPAILLSNNCVYLSHVLLSDDSSNKQRLLLSMMGNIVPELWQQAGRGRLNQIGHFGPYRDYWAAVAGIRALAYGNRAALTNLDRAERFHTEAENYFQKHDYTQTILSAEKAHKNLLDAYCMVQRPSPGELRAFWCHNAFGVEGMTWDEAVKRLAENGFTAILPNMLWGGAAFYPSELLPTAAEAQTKGDQMKLCLQACQKYHLQCHVWKVNYNMGWPTPDEFVNKMKALGRTQVKYDQTARERWLCPSHPDNQKLEIESMLEVAHKYPVQGLHFDYIRYPARDGCFCKGCRQRFERFLGRKINRWPQDVRSDPEINKKWLVFRRVQIDYVVKEVSYRAKEIRPGIKISAAVFRNWPADRDAVGQDWHKWCKNGWLDFVCPMDYTASNWEFRYMIQNQLPWAENVPCYPGIGLSSSKWSDPTDIIKLIEQINITREMNTGGFTIFNYGPVEAEYILPRLGLGITRNPVTYR